MVILSKLENFLLFIYLTLNSSNTKGIIKKEKRYIKYIYLKSLPDQSKKRKNIWYNGIEQEREDTGK